jgi:hypothetical protein
MPQACLAAIYASHDACVHFICSSAAEGGVHPRCSPSSFPCSSTCHGSRLARSSPPACTAGEQPHAYHIPITCPSAQITEEAPSCCLTCPHLTACAAQHSTAQHTGKVMPPASRLGILKLGESEGGIAATTTGFERGQLVDTPAAVTFVNAARQLLHCSKLPLIPLRTPAEWAGEGEKGGEVISCRRYMGENAVLMRVKDRTTGCYNLPTSPPQPRPRAPTSVNETPDYAVHRFDVDQRHPNLHLCLCAMLGTQSLANKQPECIPIRGIVDDA